MKIKQVVGIAFIENNKLLIVQSRNSSKTNSYTFIGGGVEEGETLVEAAKREVSEEIHSGFTIKDEELELVFEKTEQAASDPNLTISMHVFLAHKKINVPLIPNNEILIYHWYSMDEDYNVSNSIRDFLEYAKENNIIANDLKR
ncbi:hydrolase NUDIX family [Mycoplasma sp. CAG:776]|nr:hydrolase NUDIX family [Mycoplasma sp. CAG:776]